MPWPCSGLSCFGLLIVNRGRASMAAYLNCGDHRLATYPYIYYYYYYYYNNSPYVTPYPTVTTYTGTVPLPSFTTVFHNFNKANHFFPSSHLFMDSSPQSIVISELDGHCGAGSAEPAHDEQSIVTKDIIVGDGETHRMLRSKRAALRRVRDGGRVWKAKSVVMSSDGSEPTSHGFESVELRCTETTVMIKNIPNKFTETLLEIVDDYCRRENEKAQRGVHGITAAYDFLYLPIDFGSKGNKGYAFVNFTTPSAAWNFRLSFKDHKWDVHNSKKICQITCARIQGKDALIEHFKGTVFPCVTDEYLPVYFEPSRDGSVVVKQCVVGRVVGSSRQTS